jgi:SAM-dependent methyltransferase
VHEHKLQERGVDQATEPKWIALGHPSYVWRFGQDRRLALIQKYAPLEDNWILDVGCGIGTYVRKFRNFSEHVVGIDVDEERVAEGAKSIPHLFVSEAEVLPFQDQSFDVVLLNEVIEHVRDDAQTIGDVLRVLRPGGRLIIFAPNRLYFFETHGIYLGRRYIFRLIPFVNWLPDVLRSRFCPHVRAYTAGDIERLFRGQPAKILHHGYVFPGFDNIVARHPTAGKILRGVFYALERTPLQCFGLSHFVVAERLPT